MEVVSSNFPDDGSPLGVELTNRSPIIAPVATLGGHGAARPIESRLGFDFFGPDVRYQRLGRMRFSSWYAHH